MSYQEALNFYNNGNLQAAQKVCNNILKTDPSNADAYHLLGIISYREKNYIVAKEYIGKALELNPENLDYYNNYGSVMYDIGDFEQAIKYYKHVIKQNANHPRIYYNLANCLIQIQKFAEAEGLFQTALAKEAEQPGVYLNLGVALREQGKYKLALQAFKLALAIRPDYPECNWNLARLYFLLHDIPKAWQNFAERWRQPNFVSIRCDQGLPLWNGEELLQHKLLVWGEQGIGDQIMFAQLIPRLLNEIGSNRRRVTIACDNRIISLLKTNPDLQDVEILDYQQVPAKFTYHLPFGDLGIRYCQDVASFPRSLQFIFPEDAKVNLQRNQLQARAGNKKLIGIAWQGGKGLEGKIRSIPYQDLADALSIFNNECMFVNLQHGVAREDYRKDVDSRLDLYSIDNIDPLLHLPQHFELIKSLDVVISADNSNVHFAGCIGVKTFAMIPFVADWRWQADSLDNLWYQNVVLLRQDKLGSWDNVFKEVQANIRRLLCPTQ